MVQNLHPNLHLGVKMLSRRINISHQHFTLAMWLKFFIRKKHCKSVFTYSPTQCCAYFRGGYNLNVNVHSMNILYRKIVFLCEGFYTLLALFHSIHCSCKCELNYVFRTYLCNILGVVYYASYSTLFTIKG